MTTDSTILAIKAQLENAFRGKDEEIERLRTALKAAREFINQDSGVDWRIAKQETVREIDRVLE